MGSDDSGRGSIAFFGTYRPPVPLDIYSCPADPPPSSREDEHHLTDGVSYNQNGRAIPAAALKELLTFLGKKNPALAAECGATPDDAEQGRVAGLVFVSERDKGLETLHVALVRPKGEGGAVKVLSLGDVYGAGTFGGSRMEDSGCVAGGFKVGARAVGHSLVYVSTKEPVTRRRTPWTVVYRTNLADGKTERLTPPGRPAPQDPHPGRRVADVGQRQRHLLPPRDRRVPDELGRVPLRHGHQGDRPGDARGHRRHDPRGHQRDQGRRGRHPPEV
ncbi:unnamed protein product [Triticum turgidum subsp. durum]|uniref:Uncharacterized protein n=1 Tax=Triticum turgidum subsp. durum TaxID=4567 RepID=A0A9R0SRA1_TRITD|nr:unnamed protein product [Triticum turgidum subsp. durum]